MKRFHNDLDQLVTEALDGLVRTSGGDLVWLDGAPHTKVVVSAAHDRARVAVLSGGGAGHEPAHAGFVGDGMLAGAISGEVFASPSVDAVLAAILATTGDAGCLLVVKNYTGDRLNFGLAAERAKALGHAVEVVIVSDDVALPDAPHPRGIAGTLFVHKIAGHHARAGASLAEVKRHAASAAEAIRSLGLSLSTCTLPGRPRDERLAANEAELGLGIHGEPGVDRIDMGAAKALVDRVAERLDDGGSEPLVALMNNLGAVPPMEMTLLARELLSTKLGARIELVVGPAPLMTSLDMNGFSISVMPLDDARREALTSPVAPGAWPRARAVRPVETRPLDPALGARAEVASDDPAVRGALSAICEALITSEADLDALDAKIGDGDAGSTLAGAARAIRGDLDALPLADPARLFAALSQRLTARVGGSSGVLLAILTAAAGESFAGDWLAAVRAGVDRMSAYGGARVGDRTMLDAFVPALDAWSEGRAAAAAAARDGANATAQMSVARAGRASYVGAEALSGVVDPGAEAVARVFEALAR